MATTTTKKSRRSPAGAEAPVDLRAAKALAHPLRVQILAILDQRTASPKEMSKELGVPLSGLSYHVSVLEKFGCVKLESTAQRRGAVEHYYSAAMRPYFSDRDWRRLPRAARQGISSAVVRMIVEDSVASLDAGVFDAREDRHLSRLPLVLDEQGWGELNDLLKITLERALDIQSGAEARLSEKGADGIASKLSILHFESPGDAPDRQKA